MVMSVFWTDTALESLEIIFEFYNLQAGKVVAKKIIKKIVDSTIHLETNPKSGQREELLKNRGFEYRYIINGNHKIIYWIDGKTIKIATVFDCRQNPTKLVILST